MERKVGNESEGGKVEKILKERKTGGREVRPCHLLYPPWNKGGRVITFILMRHSFIHSSSQQTLIRPPQWPRPQVTTRKKGIFLVSGNTTRPVV